jgi:hypothetical protein
MGLIRAGPVPQRFLCTLSPTAMSRFFFSALAGTLLLSGAAQAQAQAPASELQALTHRLNELIRSPKPESEGEVLVSLADCGIKQTVRKYRTPEHPSATNVNVSSSKNGSSWGVRTDEKVEFELNLGLEWSEVGSISYAPDQDKKTGRRYYELTVKRREKAPGKSSSGLDSLSLDLNTQNEKEVAEVVRRLEAVSRGCKGKKS